MPKGEIGREMNTNARRHLPPEVRADPNICRKCLGEDDYIIKLDRKEKCKLCNRRSTAYHWKSTGCDNFTKTVICLPCSERERKRVFCQVCGERCPPKPRWKRYKPSLLYSKVPPPPAGCSLTCVSDGASDCVVPMESSTSAHAIGGGSSTVICSSMHRLSLQTSQLGAASTCD